MKRNQYGFSLLEFLVYFSVLTVFSLVVFQTISYAYHQVVGYGKHTNHFLEWYVARDMVMRDLQEFPYDSKSIITLEPHVITWRVDNKEIGWYVDENQRLIRTQREYDSKEQRWKKKVVSLVATSITSLVITPQRNQHRITSLEVVYEGLLFGKPHTMKQLVTMRNREVV